MKGFPGALILSAVFAALLCGCGKPSACPEKGRVLRLALPVQPGSSLLFIALDKGFFKDEGLNIAVTEYPSGKRAMEAMNAGNADISATGDIPFVLDSFKNPRMRVLASLAISCDSGSVIARRDMGVEKESDLKGRRIATQHGSAIHFYLDSFLHFNKLSANDVELVFLQPEFIVPALASGQVAAVSVREPFTSMALAHLKDNAVHFRCPGMYLRSELLLTTVNFAGRRMDCLVGFMKALARAEDLMEEKPEEAVAIISSRLEMSVTEMKKSQDRFIHKLSLPQILFPIFELEAMWCLEHKLANGEVPDFSKLICPLPLEKARPSALTMIR